MEAIINRRDGEGEVGNERRDSRWSLRPLTDRVNWSITPIEIQSTTRILHELQALGIAIFNCLLVVIKVHHLG